ncbi:MAG: hypothetical protein PHY09_18370 [Desulfuromonadaceae bacterium]|nr:hypothetical protein [Desulfuromonadaceae bacterium]MDD5107601.1 hypothetical protein [Desulfuromonadaceae bacterium]
MSKADELRATKNAAEDELLAARRQLSEAQSRYITAKKKYAHAIDAWVAEVEKTP